MSAVGQVESERSLADHDVILLEDSSDNSEGFDDYDGHFDNPTEPTTKQSSVAPVSEYPQIEKGVVINQLSNNDDFISLSDSEESDGEKEKEEKDGTNVEAAALSGDNATKKQAAVTPAAGDYPWITNHDHSKQKEIADWLTLEVKDFISYISPNRVEIKQRNTTIGKIRAAVSELWPDADLHVFGSYATDLYLPGSDIDCVVNSKGGDKENQSSLYKLATHLKKNGLATEIEIIAKARVPIIKFVEPESRIHIDVSFERINGLEAAKLIREWLESTPGLRELVLIIKQFLHSRRLNNVHTGGLGGFSIICLVYSFLSMHPRVITNEIDPIDNLGVLLIDFFELYGKNFGYDDVAISLSNGVPSYLPKREWRELHPIRNSFALAIQDPGDRANNISRGTFNIRDIKKAFAGAFDLLTIRCYELDQALFSERVGKSILGNVIKYKGKQRDFKDERNLVLNKAIIENEDFHKKRSRTDDDDELDKHNDGKPEKKRSKTKKPKKTSKRRSQASQVEAYQEDNDDYNPQEY
ncbi:non-canonical poly(A) polymerase PAP2 KNAG_0A01440 [Huiozyma naganishii CBS 8797]|uniref:polynucleotide adenylyltransferase n=1 Tax=Huiozyma naganishii (strain ATCC MYA-139 / BCRC 22969 / CBS 8797 / KCTC 17520 / NBRC 10181 / NCYC 3082 / Yp74L-3) TaxID=1071383 RepID=J7RE48_HUIN7|nr:hypothetical protein KNAG_0A01440 [Kazachstania naganishii CBS 8797]CCK67833.1 hypothetical protein KNAG_0A01440 [Kazachstania naganishii CBS 8797]